MVRELEVHSPQDSETIVREEWTPFVEGTRWRCIRCGWCCRQPWAVNMTWPEYDRTLRDPRFSPLVVDRLEVEEGTGRSHPYFVIDGACPLLDEGRNLCRVHPDWFYTCATWPFLLMPDGRLMVNRRCSGFGGGPVIKEEDMASRIKRERARAGML